MSTSTDRLVYYTLSTGGPTAAAATAKLVRSVTSLRAHDRAVPVRLFLFGALDPEARGALEACDVAVDDMGPYEEHLASLCPPRMSEVLARYPTLHKFTCLPRLAASGASRVLGLDSDTFFFRDAGALFDRYADLELYAREEPFARASPLGYRPESIDEDALAALAAREGASPVAPFNIGVMLYNHGSFQRLAERLSDLLRLVFGFSVWLADRTEVSHADLALLREQRRRLVLPEYEALALPYPSQNAWIKDQVAAWLACGMVPGLRVGTFAPHDVIMGGEIDRVELGRHVMVHYFSTLEESFAPWLVDLGLASAPVLETSAALAPGSGVPSMRILSELGEALDDGWQRLDYDERVFPELSAQALREAKLHLSLSADDVVRWLVGAPEIPKQEDPEARSGHQPVTVYRGRRFYIEVLLPAEGSSDIHRHAFSGASVTLGGPLLEVRYAFDPRWRVSSHLLLGNVRCVASALVPPGEVTEITHDLIHSTCHLALPAATVVVRTCADQEAAIPYAYFPPTVAVDPVFEDAATKRRLQALRFLRRTKQPGHVDLAAELAQRADLHTAWVVLLDAYRHLGSAARARPVLDAARARHGAAIDDLAAALDEELRRRKLRQVRERVTDPGKRFFLALLENLPDRASIEAAVQQRSPGVDPRAWLVRHLEGLSGPDILGVDLSDRLSRELVLAMLSGVTSLGGILSRLEAVFDPGDVAAGAGRIARQCDRIRKTTLAPLFV